MYLKDILFIPNMHVSVGLWANRKVRRSFIISEKSNMWLSKNRKEHTFMPTLTQKIVKKKLNCCTVLLCDLNK